MAEPDELDCKQNIFPKCPYCGYDDEDYYEYAKEGEFEYECMKCGKKFIVECETVVMFNTRKA